MTDFRPCPSYPGYSASVCGTVRRDKPRADGAPFDLKPTASGRVNLVGMKPVALDRIVADAWGDLAPPVTSRVRDPYGRPKSSYADGRVLTLREWFNLVQTLNSQNELLTVGETLGTSVALAASKL